MTNTATSHPLRSSENYLDCTDLGIRRWKNLKITKTEARIIIIDVIRPYIGVGIRWIAVRQSQSTRTIEVTTACRGKWPDEKVNSHQAQQRRRSQAAEA
ncbi:hypothetical protein LB505_008797 [Fusarium chuoi]|nr:hypothetical protein LB505_008797 [Fusarium chuoi]